MHAHIHPNRQSDFSHYMWLAWKNPEETHTFWIREDTVVKPCPTTCRPSQRKILLFNWLESIIINHKSWITVCPRGAFIDWTDVTPSALKLLNRVKRQTLNREKQTLSQNHRGGIPLPQRERRTIDVTCTEGKHVIMGKYCVTHVRMYEVKEYLTYI